ncbi:stonustoxin subunit alpha [Plakobranchus ocellatus]|uniref:Stonustoxin subunit alpha n=1 Tax=Plakobranchus ocellatus TaxID=259542 RepID=A0AAV3ZUQ2_9GAST|nr:stonustoxin subunit alpha [Plakobranchus ocellatus]
MARSPANLQQHLWQLTKMSSYNSATYPPMMSVGVLILPYIIPMLLGRSFDVFTSQVGVDIFPQSSIQTPIRIQRSFVSSDFSVIRNDSEARQFLGVSDDLSLRVKAGVLHIAATGEYLKDVQTRENYVEILVKSQYETVSETLHGTVEPIQDWDLQSPTYLGTHYVRTVTYGGMMVASLRLYVSDEAQKEAVESFLMKYFSYDKVEVQHKPNEGRLTREFHSFEDKLKRMVYAVEDTVGSGLSMQIKYYSTVTAPHVPQDIDSFLAVLEEFPDQAAKVNGGRGVPLKVELVPLHELSARMIAMRPNKYLAKTLEDMDDKFNDLLVTHAAIREMSEKTKPDDYKENCEVHDLGDDIHGKLDIFKDVIRRLDTASPASLYDSKRAIQAYEQKEEPDRPWGYYSKFKQMEKKAQEGGHLISGSNTRDAYSKKHGTQRSHTNVEKNSPNNLKKNPFASVYPQTAYSSFTPLDHFGYLAEMSMANGVCASLNKFSGNFLTLRRNCTVQGVTCSAMCWSLHSAGAASAGQGFAPGGIRGVGVSVSGSGGSWGECVGVVVAELHVSQDVAVGARTINLGRGACDRVTCLHEYCCCRMGSRMGML